MKYNPKKIEKKWQAIWKKKKIFQAKDFSPKERVYILDMFPYPSGSGFHVGHVLGYTASDILSKFHIMRGKNVLHPMGWDAFGLPAENFAIKNKVHPAKVVKQNIANFKKELDQLGLGYDWSREINTTDPEYYKWTQWIFVKLFEKGLAYEVDAPINWCPKDKTGLANEEVINGKCERCGAPVEQKKLRQWVLKITAYADRLLEDLKLVNWPQKVKTMQENWIGKSEGALIEFAIGNSRLAIQVFTTRPDTLFGATFVVLAPEHPLLAIRELPIANRNQVEEYIEQAKHKLEEDRMIAKEKTGIELKGIKAINPATKKEIPLFVADYVLTGYGTGAIMAVPAHDERDFEFAKKHNISTREVVIPERIDKRNPPVPGKKSVERQNVHAIVKDPKTGKYLCLRWKKHPWVTFPMGGVEQGEDIIEAARREVQEETGYRNMTQGSILGGQVRAEYFAAHKDENRVSYTSAVSFELVDNERDPMTKEEQEAYDVIWVDKKDLTTSFMTHAEMDVWLVRMNNHETSYGREGVLINSGRFSGMTSEDAKQAITEFVGGAVTTNYKLRDWIFSRQRYWGEPIPIIKCPKHGNVPVPEKDLPVKLPNVKSYEPTGTGESPLANISKWVNVKCPTCKQPAKRETNTMPQWAGSCWYYLRYLDTKNKKNLINPEKEQYWMGPTKENPSGGVDSYIGGVEHAVLHLLYARFWHKFLYDLGVVSTKEPFYQLMNQGTILGPDGQKMSKSKGNVVPAERVINQYGADVLRTYEMFMGPFEDVKPWDEKGIVGVKRFLDRIYILSQEAKNTNDTKHSPETQRLLHETIKKVTEDINQYRFNTVVSALMILSNSLEDQKGGDKGTMETVIKMLAPFAPHISEEMWQNFGHKKSIFREPWPTYDPKLIEKVTATIIIQINGKLRGQIMLETNADEQTVQKASLELPEIKKWIEGKNIRKVIYIKNKLINFVVG